jgi:hypothetical protein
MTSINMKVSSRLHNHRIAMVEQNYRLGSLLNQRPFTKSQNSSYILKKFINNNKGMLELPWHPVILVRLDLQSLLHMPSSIENDLEFSSPSVLCSIRLCMQSLCARDLRLPETTVFLHGQTVLTSIYGGDDAPTTSPVS